MITFLNGSAAAGSVAWGAITGTITAQTDLIAAIETPTNDTVYAANKGPVILAPDSTKNRLEITNAKVLQTEEIA